MWGVRQAVSCVFSSLPIVTLAAAFMSYVVEHGCAGSETTSLLRTSDATNNATGGDTGLLPLAEVPLNGTRAGSSRHVNAASSPCRPLAVRHAWLNKTCVGVAHTETSSVALAARMCKRT